MDATKAVKMRARVAHFKDQRWRERSSSCGFDWAKSRAPCSEIEKAQNPVPNNVAGLPSEAVPEFVANGIEWSEQPREERIKIAASVAGRKHVARLGSDDEGPEDRCQPRLPRRRL